MILGAVCAIVVPVAVLGSGADPVSAATFTVNTTADARDTQPGDGACRTAANTCSLRAAIQEANAATSADTITVPAGVFSLNASDPGGYTAGTRALQISSNVTIRGAGSLSTVIDGLYTTRVLDIQRFVRDEAFTVNISNLGIWRGSATIGGGVLIGRGITSNFTGVMFDANRATGGSLPQGGGMYVWGQVGQPSTTTITSSVFIRNTAAQGGGIVNGYPSAMTLVSTKILNNTATGLYGGGISSNGSLTLISSVVDGNTAGFGASSGGPTGGGIYSGNPPNPAAGQSSVLVMHSGSVTNNRVPTNLLSNGGGIANMKAGLASLQGVYIAGNSAFTGGGLLNDQGTVWFIGATVAGNTASYGGGIYNNDFEPLNTNKATISLDRSLVYLNWAKRSGCPQHLLPPGQLCGAGGGIFAENGITRVVNSTVADNFADTFGGGLYNLRIGSGTTAGALFTLTHATVTRNRTSIDGGGLINNGGTFNVKGSILADNSVNGQPSDCQVLPGSPTVTLGYNVTTDGRCGFGQTGDKLASALLGPVAANGGITMSSMPAAGSPAVNAGSAAICAAAPVSSIDQRGFNRPSACDIGAVER
jgi:CSLREA domain-containing protein